jgi:hypothetical protein
MVVCAWCNREITRQVARRHASSVSHGICPSCLQERLARLNAAAARAA